MKMNVGHRGWPAAVWLVLASVSTLLFAQPAAAENQQCADFDTSVVTSSEGATISRLYCAAFRRSPEADGYPYRNDLYERWVSLRHIAGVFADSEEWQLTFGETTDNEFISLMYRHVFDREPDEPGAAYWLDQMTGESPGPMSCCGSPNRTN